MPSDCKREGPEEVSGPGLGPEPAPGPDPAGGSEEKGGSHHVIDVVVVAEEKEKVSVAAAAAKKGCLSRSDSGQEQCRICQQPTEEPIIVLGCRCRGELSKAHRSCIEIWFRTRGSNKCEICQQVAANVPSPDSQLSTNYWVWRIDGRTGGQGNRERQCFSPLRVAFAILVGGFLLDVLISVSLGVSAIPVNIIIGVLVVLGLGTAFRLALECCHEWGSRRNVERAQVNINQWSHPSAV